MRKKFFKIAGNIITVLAIIFVIKKIAEMQIDLSVLSGFKPCIIFITLSVLSGIFVYLSAIPWTQMLYITTKRKIAYVRISSVACKANLMKYIPGNIFQYVGRNELAENEHFRHRDVAMATVMDVVISVIGMAFVALIFYSKGILVIIENYKIQVNFQLIGVLFLATVFLAYVYVKKAHGKLQVHLVRGDVSRILFAIVYYIVWGTIYGILYYVTLTQILQCNVPMNQTCTVIGAFLCAWVLGYIIPGVPGGIGVRETLVVLLLAEFINQDVILLAAVLFRFINIIGDILAYILSSYMLIIDKKIDKYKRTDT